MAAASETRRSDVIPFTSRPLTRQPGLLTERHWFMSDETKLVEYLKWVTARPAAGQGAAARGRGRAAEPGGDRGDGFAGCQEVSARRKTSGDCSPKGVTRSPRSPPIAAGTSTRWHPRSWVWARPATVGSSRVWRSSTPGSSASRRAKRWRWIRSSACCWRPRGRRSSAPGWIRSRCAASRTGVFVGVAGADYTNLVFDAAEDVQGHALTGLDDLKCRIGACGVFVRA